MAKQEVLIIDGSARAKGNTFLAIRELCPFSEYTLIELSALHIHQYDYDHKKNVGDDFHDVVLAMQKAKVIVFATPVYWYTMSGRMKALFDRFTELLSTYKSIGKDLKGKQMLVIATGSSPTLPPGFEEPFKLTANYFEMQYSPPLYRCSK